MYYFISDPKLSIDLTRRERIAGWVYFLLQLTVLPTALALLFYRFLPDATDAQLNFAFFGVNFLAVVVIFRRFLYQSLVNFREHPLRGAFTVLLGYLAYVSLSSLVMTGILYLRPDFFSVNDAAIDAISETGYGLMAAGSVLLVPVAEECFFRGLVFSTLQKKHRWLAYSVSALAFAAVHVAGYIGSYDWELLLLCLVQYIPAGIALGWVYEQTDTICTPILLHMTVNALSFAAGR